MILLFLLGLKVHDFEETKRINPILLRNTYIQCNAINNQKEYKDMSISQNLLDCRSGEENVVSPLLISDITFESINCNNLLYTNGIDVTMDNCVLKKVRSSVVCPINFNEGVGKTATMRNTTISDCTAGNGNAPFSGMIMFNCERAIVQKMEIDLNVGSTDTGNGERGIQVHTGNKNVDFSDITIRNARGRNISNTAFPGGICINTIDSTITLNRLNIHTVDSTSCNEGCALQILQSTNTPITVMNSNFTNCGTTGFAVKCNGGPFIFKENIILFTDSNRNCEGLYFKPTGTFNSYIEDNQFIRCRGTSDSQSALLVSTKSELSIKGNTFDECYNTNNRCAHITSTGTLIFENNIFQNNPAGAYLLVISHTEDVLEIRSCKFFNNTCDDEFGGGTGIWFYRTTKYTIRLTDCIYENNYANRKSDQAVGGAFQISSKSNDNVNVEVLNCKFIGNKARYEGGAIAIQIKGYCKIEGCTFRDNIAGYVESSSQLLAGDRVAKGGAIFLDPTTQTDASINNEIIQCTFDRNTASDGGSAIYYRGTSNTQAKIILDATNKIYNSGEISEAINLGSTPSEKSEISNKIETGDFSSNEFPPNTVINYNGEVYEKVNNRDENSPEGNVFHFTSNLESVTLTNCVFRNCGTSGYVVVCDKDGCEFNGCIFEFDFLNESCGVLKITAKADITITNCQFIRCNSHQFSRGGLSIEDATGDVTFTKCLFDNCCGKNERAFGITCFHANLRPHHNITIQNFKIKLDENTNSSEGYQVYFGYTGSFNFKDNGVPSVVFQNYSFYNNTAGSKHGGGCGFWVQMVGSNVDQQKEMRINFLNCEWINNSAVHNHAPGTDPNRTGAYNGMGGGFQFGFTETNCRTELEFENCLFQTNQAEREGGALCIQTTQDCTITYCRFISNQASEGAGGVFINPDFVNNRVEEVREQRVDIMMSYFENNNGGTDGHALYMKGEKAEFRIINKNVFSNNGGNRGSTIYVASPEFEFENNEINFSNNASYSRGIELAVQASISLEHIVFTNCRCLNGNGGAILLSSPATQSSVLANDQEYIISDCQFINCGATYGGGLSIGNGVTHVAIKDSSFIGGEGSGSAIHIGQNIGNIKIQKSVKFINQTGAKFIIYSECDNLELNGNEFITEVENGGMAICIKYGTATIKNIFFEHLQYGIEVQGSAGQVTVENCIFSDFIRSRFERICDISNKNCRFINNTFNFSDNIKMRAVNINGNGDIVFSHNKLYKCGGDAQPAFYFNNMNAAAVEGSVVTINYNTFEQCNGGNNQKCYFEIVTKYDFNFDHNTLKDCTCNNYASHIDICGISSFTLTNFTMENVQTSSQFGGALGLWLRFRNEKNNAYIQGTFIFDRCNFRNNKAKLGGNNALGVGGAFNLGYGTNNGISTTFRNCTFENNKSDKEGGALGIQSKYHAVIQDCIFRNNFAGYSDKIQSSKGGAIYIDTENNGELDTCTISNCTFEGNTAKGENYGSSIYMKCVKTRVNITNKCVFRNNGGRENKGYAIYSEAHYLDISNSEFSQSDHQYGSSGILFNLAKTSTIRNVTFRNLNGRNDEYVSNSIYIMPTAENVEVEDCLYYKCGNHGGTYTIYDSGKNVIINKCNFTREDDDINTAIYKIVSVGSHTFTNIYIRNAYGDQGTIFYEPTIETGVSENFVMQYVNMERIKGQDYCAIYMAISNSQNIQLDHITVHDCIFDGRRIFGFNFGESVSEFTFDHFNFSKLNSRHEKSGGIGLYLDLKSHCLINFVNCTFVENLYPSNVGGGALHVGSDSVLSLAEVIIEECLFQNNHADHNGGAVSISTGYQTIITKCKFIGNQANGQGGAIYVNADDSQISEHMSSCLITNCTFDGNKVGNDERNSASAIYLISSHESSQFEITNDCKFLNSPGKTFIVSECKNLRIHSLLFQFNTINNAGRAIRLTGNGNSEISNVHFIKCAANGDGDAIMIDSDISSADIHDCIFEDVGRNGHSIVVKGSPVTITNNVFSYSSTADAGGAIHISVSGRVVVSDCQFIKMNGRNAVLRIASKSKDEEDFIISNLLFTECIGGNPSIFGINTMKPFTLTNVTIQNSPRSDYMCNFDFGGSADDLTPLLFDECRWINNNCSSKYGGGIGLWITNGANKPMRVEYTKCIFENNQALYPGNSGGKAKGGAIQDGFSVNTANKYLTFRECNFTNNQAGTQGGALAIETQLYFEIDTCSFISNVATSDGGAIFINADFCSGGLITQCKFVTNSIGSGNGINIRIEKSISSTQTSDIIIDGTNIMTPTTERGTLIYSNCKGLIVNNMKFVYTPTSNQAQSVVRAFNLGQHGSTTINNCTFINIAPTGLTDPDGAAIRIEKEAASCEILGCIFTDCGKNMQKSRYAIRSEGYKVIFTNNVINFTNTNEAIGGIATFNYSAFSVLDSEFKNCQNNGNGGGVAYNPNKNNFRPELCNVELIRCIFDNCGGGNGRAAFGKLAKYTTVQNCTFKNMKGKGYIFTWGHEDSPQAQAVMDNVIFMDNSADCGDGGGGSGLWYSQVGTLTLRNCQFIRNSLTNSNANGGALGYAPSSKSLQNVELIFVECLFEDNEVQGDTNGSALWINSPIKPVFITDCIFNSSKAASAKFGGAIYITQNSKTITISGSTFNHVIAKNKGSAIYIEKGNENVEIKECSFIDCCGSNQNNIPVIYSEGKKVIFEKSTIEFSSTTKSSLGMDIYSRSILELVDSKFIRCWSNQNGGGLVYCNNKGAADQYQERIILSNVLFDNCDGSNGRALFGSSLVAATFEYITIQNTNSKTFYIFTWGHQQNNNVESVVIDHCKFINLSSNIPDHNGGDGGGIGLWMTDTNHLEFIDCEFIGCTSSQHGGAVAFSNNKAKQIPTTFTRCYFENNQAGGRSSTKATGYNGSALFINTQAPFTISQCNFSQHSISGYGGCIYVTSLNRHFTIVNTEFHHCQETTQGNGNAIYLEKGLIYASLTNCKFVDCGTKGSVIDSNCIELNILKNQFIECKGAVSLSIKYSNGLNVSNTTFKDNSHNDVGGAIFYEGAEEYRDIEVVSIVNCIFDNNNATNGCAFLIKPYTIPILKDLVIRNHRNGNFIFTVFYKDVLTDEVNISGCTFENNYFQQDPNNGGGSGFWVAVQKNTVTTPYPVTLHNCTFKHNQAANNGGALAYGQSDTLKNIYLTLNNCHFEDNFAGNQGGALHLNAQVQCVIEACTFENNYILNDNNKKEGGAIFFGDRAVTSIVSTLFLDCDDGGSAIVFTGKEIMIDGSTIEFDNVTTASRGIEFRNKAEIEILNSRFAKCSAFENNDDTQRRGGALYYDESISTQNTLSFILEDCEFDSNIADNGCALLIDISSPPEIRRCKIKNHNTGNYVFCIFFEEFQYSCELEECIFESNHYKNGQNAEDSGGSGIWIANQKEIAAGRTMQLLFNGCEFINNNASYCGGAFAYGRSDTVKGTELTFDSCIFNGNYAPTGGALWIITTSATVIQSCNFRNNVAGQKAGSVYIDAPAPLFTIEGSTFEYDSATSGNSLYVTSQVPNIVLHKNHFIDCGIQENVIVNDNKLIDYVENTIEFSYLEESCRGLNLKTSGEITIRNSSFLNCNISTNSEKGGGLVYQNENGGTDPEIIIITNCRFSSCLATVGCALYIKPKIIPEMSYNTIEDCKLGHHLLRFDFVNVGEYTLEGWTFKNNQASNSVLQDVDDGGASGIWIASTVQNENINANLTFKKCTWESNNSPYGGAFAYGKSNFVKQMNLIFDECLFISNKCKSNVAGALLIFTNAKIDIINCNFTNNKALGSQSSGGAIYFDDSSNAIVNIIDSYFTKNEAIDANALYLPRNLGLVTIQNCEITTNGNTGSTILSSCSDLYIQDSKIGFGAYTLSNRGLHCITKCVLTILHSSFENCNAQNDQSGQGGGIRYQVQNQIETRVEKIIIEDTKFINCKGQNGVALYLLATESVTFRKNTIQDCRQGGFILTIISQKYIDLFVIEGCIFKHNFFDDKVKSSHDGGGSGIWVANDKVLIQQGSYNHLRFDKCTWIDNSVKEYGGAFAYGFSDTVLCTELIFAECSFQNNVARGQLAGAIYIRTNQSVLLNNCTFSYNKASGTGGNGGAIVIESKSTDTPSINIFGCSFTGDNAKDGNAIYVLPSTIDINVTECTFNDCGSYGSVIKVESQSFTLDTCYIIFTTAKGSRGIGFNSRCLATIRDSQFIQCRSTGDGGGLYYQNNLNSQNEEDLLIEGCLFDNCKANNGAAILAYLDSPIQFQNNLIWHHTEGKFIISVFYTSYVNETIVKDCYFEHNYFNKETNGGGSGIWIACAQYLVEEGTYQKISFLGCTWRNNTAANYGGGFAYGRGSTVNSIELEFEECNFINNTAKIHGGALYIITQRPLRLNECFFDGNTASQSGGAVYFSKFGLVDINDCKFARNVADEAGAIYGEPKTLFRLQSSIFSDNTAHVRGSSLFLNNFISEESQDSYISSCKFGFEKKPSQYQIYLTGNNEGQSIVFMHCCFTHHGDNGETVTHINSNMEGTLNLGEGNCFNLKEELSYSILNTSEVIKADGIFECNTCEVPEIETSPPTNMPTASPGPTYNETPKPTDVPIPTPKPTIVPATPEATEPGRTPVPTISGHTPAPTAIETPDSSDKDDSGGESGNIKSKKSGLIAGIVIASLVIIAVVVVLIWMIVCGNLRPSGGYYPDNDTMSASTVSRTNEMEDETVNGISGLTGIESIHEEPIWSGTASANGNPLFEGNAEDDEEIAGAINDFEESWAEI